MTSSDNFTEKEWKMLVFSPSFTANNVASSDGSISKNETLKITQTLLKARDRYTKDHLIYLILSDLPDMIEAQDFPGELRYIKTLDEAERAYKKLGKIVDSKASSQEARDYKLFIITIAESVANASGGFFQLFGEPVSTEEGQYCTLIRQAFGLPISPNQVNHDNK